MKYGHIDTLRHAHPVAAICRALAVSESGYYAWHKRPPSLRARANARLETEIKAAHERSRQTYGPERMQAELADNGIQVGVHRIKRIRRQLGLRCKQKRKFIATTDSAHTLPVAANVLNREFAATAPNKVWVTDITYIATDEGWLYLAGVKDVFSGSVNGAQLPPQSGLDILMTPSGSGFGFSGLIVANTRRSSRHSERNCNPD